MFGPANVVVDVKVRTEHTLGGNGDAGIIVANREFVGAQLLLFRFWPCFKIVPWDLRGEESEQKAALWFEEHTHVASHAMRARLPGEATVVNRGIF